MDKQVLDEYMETLKSQYDKYYSGFSMHPEEGKEVKINGELEKIQNDLMQIDNALISAGQHVYALMTNTILRLNNIHENIMLEKERYQDMQMLCNKYNDYDNVKLLEDKDFKGMYTHNEGKFSSVTNKTKDVKLHVVNVAGNGYEGNKYVYKDYIYTESVLDTSIRTNITDESITSYYEYSRITVGNNEDACQADFNKDNKEAQCTITFQAEELINEVEVKTDDTSIIITKVSYSTNGVDYIDMNIPYISINNKLDSYGNFGYIYGSGKIVFPQKIQLFRITFQSTGYKNDIIAYEKALIKEEYYYDEMGMNSDVDPIPTYEVDEVTTIIKSARRHVIKINEVKAGLYQYGSKGQMKSRELISQEVNAISVFANVYIPQGLHDDSIEFILTVNGIDHVVVPINSHMNGIKVIRFSTGNASSPYTERIGEKIKSAYLTINFNSETKASPYVNNIKILLGGEL